MRSNCKSGGRSPLLNLKDGLRFLPTRPHQEVESRCQRPKKEDDAYNDEYSTTANFCLLMTSNDI